MSPRRIAFDTPHNVTKCFSKIRTNGAFLRNATLYRIANRDTYTLNFKNEIDLDQENSNYLKLFLPKRRRETCVRELICR